MALKVLAVISYVSSVGVKWFGKIYKRFYATSDDISWLLFGYLIKDFICLCNQNDKKSVPSSTEAIIGSKSGIENLCISFVKDMEKATACIR